MRIIMMYRSKIGSQIVSEEVLLSSVSRGIQNGNGIEAGFSDLYITVR